MICQLCLANPSTCQITERPSDGRFVVAHYCENCFAAKYEHPSPAPAPRLKFKIKSFMILAGVWALPNALTAWIMRSGWIIGTPAQLRLWTIQAFVAANLVFGFFAVWFGLMKWFSRLMWHNRTGGLIPMPIQTMDRRRLVYQLKLTLIVVAPITAWCFGALFAANWLALRLGLDQFQLWALLVLAPSLGIGLLLVLKTRRLRDQVYQSWKMASPMERALRAMTIAWTLGFVLTIAIGGPRLIGWGLTFWFPIPRRF